ncbi:hypothetical protein [Nocardioides astragali]|uniref:Calcium-binding protein n=1 Tax=Nocardioides astragali TaxID=1776736 RepID=A0ABW2NBA7_9ACTN|nr:hypothetical protein [Nocardioides astragali]
MTYSRPTAHVAALVAGLLAGPVLGPVPAHADPLTCQGQVVTVTGEVGTPGDDVMVVGSAGVFTANSGAGDDLVCIRVTTGREPFMFTVDAGPGADRVFNESTDGNTTVQTLLGTGGDSYMGNELGDTVVAGAALWGSSGDTSDTEKDTIDTRGGNDYVTSGSVAPGTPNPDVVTTGDGDDKLSWAGDLTGAPVDLAAGTNRLALYPGWEGTDLHVDATTSTVSADARPVLRWTGQVQAYLLTVDRLRTRFTGGDADEILTYAVAHPGTPGAVVLPDPDRRLDADMGAGDDSIGEQDFVGGSLLGGPGDDALQAARCLEADVRLGDAFTCLAAYNPRVEYAAAIDAWEHIHVPGGLVRVVGTSGPDDVHAAGSRVRVMGRGGDDRLVASGSRSTARTPWTVVLDGGPGADAVWGGYGHDKLVGGSGKDKIAGSSGDDLLLGGGGADRLKAGKGRDEVRGGQGRDRADGEAGRDRCSAEVRRSCERG